MLGVEHRDGTKFYVVPNSALQPVELVRAPGLRSDRLARRPKQTCIKFSPARGLI